MANKQNPPEDELAKKVNEAQKEVAAKNNAPNEEKKPVSTLESAVNESIHGIGSALKIGLAGLIPFAHASAFPTLARDTYILAGAQVAGDATTSLRRGQKYTAGNALESSLLGTAITAPVYGFYSLVDRIPTASALGYVAKGAAWAGLAYPAFIGIYQAFDYLIKNRKFSGMGKYIKENYWPTTKFAWKWLLPFSLVNIFTMPFYLQIPIGAALSYAFTLFGAPKKKEVPEDQKRDKTPYFVATSNVIGKFGKNIFYGVPQAFYAIGTSIRDLYKTSPKTAAPAQPTPAGAH